MIDVITSWEFAIFIAGLALVVFLWLVCSAGADRITVSCRCGVLTIRDARVLDPVDADRARDALTAQCPACVKASAKRAFDGARRPITKTTVRWDGSHRRWEKRHDLGPPAPTTEIIA